MLLRSVAMMTAAMLATALLPTRAEIGAGGGVAADPVALRDGLLGRRRIYRRRRLSARRRAGRRRGLIASSASAASEVGGLLAVGVSALTVASMSEADLASWGWRIPFFVRRGARRQRVDRPLDHAGIARVRAPAGARHRARAARSATRSPTTAPAIARAFAISALGSITYYVGITYVPAFLTSAGKLSESAIACGCRPPRRSS